MSSKKHRRNFLKTLFQTTLVLSGSKALASPAPPEEAKTTTKLLTPDGRLVEVDNTVLQSKKGKKVTNQEILDWRKLRKPGHEQE